MRTSIIVGLLVGTVLESFSRAAARAGTEAEDAASAPASPLEGV